MLCIYEGRAGGDQLIRDLRDVSDFSDGSQGAEQRSHRLVALAECNECDAEFSERHSLFATIADLACQFYGRLCLQRRLGMLAHLAQDGRQAGSRDRFATYVANLLSELEGGLERPLRLIVLPQVVMRSGHAI